MIACPKCKLRLTKKQNEERYSCSPCDISYPQVSNISVLFEEPENAKALAYTHLHRSEAQWQKRYNELAVKLKNSQRKKKLLPLLKAFNDNAALFTNWREDLEGQVQPKALLDINAQPQSMNYGYNFAYLTRDWSNDVYSQMQVQHILNGLKRSLRLTSTRGRACVLGMGTGRLGLELTEYFDNTSAIDSSFGQVLQYHELLNNDIHFWNINSKNRVTSESITQKTTASIPPCLKQQSHKIEYLWGDALNSPFENHSFDWVFSIYFSDIKPLPQLLKEVNRILQPGGYFLHYGPLEYHFQDIEHHYCYDEFKGYFISNGFDLMHESTNRPITHHQDKNALVSNKQYTDKVLLLRRQ